MQLKSEEISKIIKDKIKNYSNKTEQKETGYVIEVRRRHCKGQRT